MPDIVRSPLAWWRVSLRRTRADWPIVAAAALITLLAVTLVAAGQIYPAAAAQAGLRQALADAPTADTTIEVSLYGPTTGAVPADAQVQAELQRLLASSGGTIVRDWQSTETLALPALPGAKAGDQAVVGFLDGLADHARLVAGAWPGSTAAVPGDALEFALQAGAAATLGLAIGDELDLVAHPSSRPEVVKARLVGTFEATSADDPYWNADALLLTGIHDNGSYQTFGPLIATQDDLLLHAAATAVHQEWRTIPDFDRFAVDDAPRFRQGVADLAGRLQAGRVDAHGPDFTVISGLAPILADAERSLLVSRAGVLLLTAQLAILAAYALVLTASLLVDHRRIDTALLRSRGAGVAQVAAAAAAEGLLFTVPAALVAPWLASAGLDLLNRAGPLADVGLRIVPVVAADSYLAAALAGIACVALLVLPAALAARGFAAEQGSLSRQETRTFGQRLGLDVALLAVTGIALWQLRLYGAPLTRTVQGSLGLDPLLVAAPGIGIVAGGILALRILPLLAVGVESVASRMRSLTVSLSTRQLARRPLRYTRSALLLMLAVSMGVFGLSYAATWSASQRDQAAYQTGADVRVTTGVPVTGLPAWALPSAYAGLPGVVGTMPVERRSGGVSFAASGSADLLAIDAAAAASIVLVRPDEASASLESLLAPLRDGRPAPKLFALPDGTSALRIAPRFTLGAIDLVHFNPLTGDSTTEPLDPATVGGLRVNVNATIRDARGQLYRVESGVVPYTGPETAIVLSLQPTTRRNAAAVAAAGARLEGPIELAALGIDVWLPDNTLTSDAVFGIATVAATADPAGPWADIALATAGPWAAKMSRGRDSLQVVPGGQARDTEVQLRGEGELGVVFGNGAAGASAVLTFVPRAAEPPPAAVAVIANRAFVASIGAVIGDTIDASIDGRPRQLAIRGVVDSFPTTDPEQPLLILDSTTLGLLRLIDTGTVRNPDEWWLATDAGAGPGVADALRQAPFDSAGVATAADAARRLGTDPLALGIIGALALGFVATGLFAMVGLTVSAAVSARQRRTEFALLRALGLSGRQLAGSLWLENGSVVIASLLAGTGLGLLIGWIVLPFVTVTQRAAAPVPPVLVEVPWDRIVLLDVASALALGVAVVVIGSVLRRLGVGSILRMGED